MDNVKLVNHTTFHQRIRQAVSSPLADTGTKSKRKEPKMMPVKLVPIIKSRQKIRKLASILLVMMVRKSWQMGHASNAKITPNHQATRKAVKRHLVSQDRESPK